MTQRSEFPRPRRPYQTATRDTAPRDAGGGVDAYNAYLGASIRNALRMPASTDHGDGSMTLPKGLVIYLGIVHALAVVALLAAGLAGGFS